MITVHFRNNTYTLDTGDLNLQYFDSGDLHGNDNFRTQNKNWPAYEVLQQIEPALLQSALAVTIDGTQMPLTAKLTKDCTLDIITADDAEGKTIYHQTLAFLIAQAVYTLDIHARLAALSVSDTQCVLQFILDDHSACSPDVFESQLKKTMTEPAAIQIIDGFQKEMLVETYPSLSQPYPNMFLAQYDDYDFITIAARQNFVLPMPEKAILVANPTLINHFSISQSLVQNIYTVTAARK